MGLLSFNLLTASLIVGLALLILRRWVTSKSTISSIPGPALSRFSPLWLAYHARAGQRYLAVHDAHKKHGPVVRITPSHVSIACPDAISVIYGHGHRTFNKSAFYHAFVADRPSVFSTVDRQEHAQKRRNVSQAFSYNALQGFSPVIQANIDLFVQRLDSMCKSEIDLMTWLNFLTFDVLSDLAFGETIGMLTKGNDVVAVQRPNGTIKFENAIDLVDGREHLSAVVGIHPWLPFFSRLLPDPFFIHGWKSSNGLSDFARRRVTARVESGAHRDDILDHLIRARLNESGNINEEQLTELIAETVTLLSAGSDTTASSVTAIVHLVKSHPQVCEQLQAELDAAISPDALPTHIITKDLPYLGAVVEEGLRYFATMATGLPRIVPPGGVVFGGYYIPEGTEVSVPAYTIQHDESVWGDPEVFRPERWLESEVQRKHLLKYLLVFGKGPRACLGKNLAYMETHLIVATIFHRYKITLLRDRLDSMEGFVHKTLGLKVALELRPGRH